MHRVTRQSGLSLIEAMISLAIGLLIVGVLIAYFVSGHRNYRQDQEQAQMQETARFALKMLSDDIGMLGFFGESLSLTNNVSATVGNCGTGAGAPLDLTTTLFVLADADSANGTFACIADDTFVEGTDVLAIKRVEALPATTEGEMVEDSLYFRSTPSSGGLLVNYTDGSFLSGANYWRYLVHIYYIRDESLIGSGDGIPTLHRKSLTGLGFSDVNGGIARNIEYFHVEFGIDQEAIDGNVDTQPDGVANYYTPTPNATELRAAVTAKIYVLARSRNEITGYVNEKTYNMGTASRGPFDDGYYRRVFSTTLTLRNLFTRAFVQHLVEKNS